MRTIKEIRAEFDAAVARHDWTYQMSDDHSVYMAGSQNEDLIWNLIKEMIEAEPTGILGTEMRTIVESKSPKY